MSTDEILAWLGDRFEGVTVERRRSAGWPLPWRARLIASKNERSDYRLTAHAETCAGAVAMLYAEVTRADANQAAGAASRAP